MTDEPSARDSLTTEPSPSLRVAVPQLSSCGRDLDASLRKADACLRRSAAAGADLALLPELWSIGALPFDPADPRRSAMC